MKKALGVVLISLWDVLKFSEAMNWIKVKQTREKPMGKIFFAIFKTFQLLSLSRSFLCYLYRAYYAFNRDATDAVISINLPYSDQEF